MTVTFTPTVVDSPTPTSSLPSSPTPTPTFLGQGQLILAPVPARPGQRVCLYFDRPAAATSWEVFNVAGEGVARLSFMQSQNNCWDTSQAPPGIYFVEIKITYLDGTTARVWRKAALTQ
jgi:hypothetical protein